MAQEKSVDQPGLNETLRQTAQIVAAYVARNSVPVADVPRLIEEVHKSLAAISGRVDSAERPQPAVPVRRSVTPDHIVCLEDGKKLKMLKRYLKTAYDMSPAEYRDRWGLPADYPMVAPNYARARSDLAKKMGLGTRREK